MTVKRLLKAVIFDMDGVIIDSEPLHIEVVLDVLKGLDINLSYDDITRYIGISNSYMWNELAGKYSIRKTVDELIDIQHAMNIDVLDTHEDITMPGVIELLDEIKSNELKTAIASSSTIDYIDAVVDKLGIARHFDAIVSGEQVARGKPQPDIFIRAAESLGVSPAECVVIEDSDNGIRAARGAGMKVIGLKNPNSGNQSLAGADRVVHSLREITMPLLNGMVGESQQ